MRVPLIVGNWKMHMTRGAAAGMVEALLELVRGATDVEIGVAPPFTALEAVRRIVAGSNVSLGAQNVYWEDAGAFTGEISAPMLVDAGASFVIVGHSERRKYFGDTDDKVAQKTAKVLNSGLTPIVCVGELLEQREAGKAEQTVATQVRGALAGLGPDDIESLILAYEPVWAIGTGRTATSDQAQEMHAYIRSLLEALSTAECAGKVRILYGGSVKPSNIAELMSGPDVDGALVGGASLDAETFASIITNAIE